MSLVKNETARRIDSFRDGRLTEQDLLRVSEVAGKTRLRQDVLWLYAENSSPVSDVVGMRIIEDGEISDGPADPHDWPCKTVLYAWLCGKYDSFRLMGGQGWPLPPHRWRGGPYGVPSGLLAD